MAKRALSVPDDVGRVREAQKNLLRRLHLCFPDLQAPPSAKQGGVIDQVLQIIHLEISDKSKGMPCEGYGGYKCDPI